MVIVSLFSDWEEEIEQEGEHWGDLPGYDKHVHRKNNIQATYGMKTM